MGVPGTKGRRGHTLLEARLVGHQDGSRLCSFQPKLGDKGE